jgi:hypothetical protein
MVIAQNTLGISYGTDITFTTNLHMAIGEPYGGGIIFYLDGSGKHGYVVSENDQGSTSWYNGSYILTGASGTDIGTGQANTTAIIAAQGAGSYAAQICNDLVLNGYSDWFLPSADELYAIFENLVLHDFYHFPNIYYWSSTEGNSGYAWIVDFNWEPLGGNVYSIDKALSYHILAVRAF